MIEPMLCKLTKPDSIHLIGDWISEPKLDGQRLIATSEDNIIHLWTRRNKQVAKKFPEIVRALRENIPSDYWILDGELTVPGGFWNLLVRNVEDQFKINILSRKIPATYNIFDVLCYDKIDLTKKPLIDRKKKLLGSVIESENINIVPFRRVNNETVVEQFQEYVSKRFEGAILKNLNSSYEQGKRSSQWLKVKREDTVDVFIIGATKSTARPFGALVMERNGEFFGKVGTGFGDDKNMRNILKYLEENKYHLHIPIPRDVASELLLTTKPLLAEIRVNELVKEKYPRAPVWVRFRLD